MNTIRLTLFDFSRAQDGEPLQLVKVYEGELPEAVCMQKVAITTGNDTCAATVTIPLAVLTQMMGTLMEAAEKRHTGLIVPKPGIIMPN